MLTNNQALKENIKQEVLAELGAQRMTQPYSPYNDLLVNSIKNDLMAEINARQANQLAKSYGYGDLLSNQNIMDMINQRQQTMADLRAQIRRELQNINNTNPNHMGAGPNIRGIAESIAAEARQQGVPLNQVIDQLNGQQTGQNPGAGWWQRTMGMGQSRGFLYGIGAAALIYFAWTATRKNLHPIEVHSSPFDDEFDSFRNDEMGKAGKPEVEIYEH